MAQSRLIAPVDLVTGGFDNLADTWATSRNIGNGNTSFYATFEEAITALDVGKYFTSPASGEIRTYKRIAVTPFYEDQGDEAAPVPVSLVNTTIASLAGVRGCLADQISTFILPDGQETFWTTGWSDTGDYGRALFREMSPLEPTIVLTCELGTAQGEWLTANGKRVTFAKQDIDPKMFGAYADGVTLYTDAVNKILRTPGTLKVDGSVNMVGTSNDSFAIALAIEMASYLGTGVRFTEGRYLVNRNVQITNKSNLMISFGANAWIAVDPDSPYPLPHVVGLSGVEDVVVYNPQIDGQNYEGANGIGVGGGGNPNRRVRSFGGSFLNLHRYPSVGKVGDIDQGLGFQRSGGGRAVTFQFNSYECHATGYTVYNCTTAIDAHGNNAGPCLGINFSNIQAYNCEELVSFFDLVDQDSSPNSKLALQVKVSDVFGRNCGLSTSYLSVGGDSSGTNGGAIVLERAKCVEMVNVTIVNDDDYGTIGALIRGTTQHSKFKNITLHGNAVALVDHTRALNMLPLNSTASNSIRSRNNQFDSVQCTGTLTNILRVGTPGTSDSMQLARFRNIGVSTVTGPLLVNADRVDSTMDIANLVTGEVISGRCIDISAHYNVFQGVSKTSTAKSVRVVRTNGYPLFTLERTGSNSGIGSIGLLGNQLHFLNAAASEGGTTKSAGYIEPGDKAIWGLPLCNGPDGYVRANTTDRLWINQGRFMSKVGSDPTTATDGNPLGMKVTVPVSSTTVGLPGYWAADSSYLYIYTGDGTTHSWRRIATVTW